jgi:hypothetical protein
MTSALADYLEVSGQLQAPAALLPGKSPRYPLDKRLGGPRRRSGRRGEEGCFISVEKWGARGSVVG